MVRQLLDAKDDQATVQGHVGLAAQQAARQTAAGEHAETLGQAPRDRPIGVELGLRFGVEHRLQGSHRWGRIALRGQGLRDAGQFVCLLDGAVEHGPLGQREALARLSQEHVQQTQHLLDVVQEHRALAGGIRRRQVEGVDAVG